MTATTDAADDTRRAIMRSAAALFSERGFAKTKVADIARGTQISPAALYWHFPSKEAILFEYLRAGFVEFDRRVNQDLDGLSHPIDRLRAVAVRHTEIQLEFCVGGDAITTFSTAQLMPALSDEHSASLAEFTATHYRRVRAIVTDGVRRGVFDVHCAPALIFGVMNICEYSALWFRRDGPATISQIAAANGDLAVRMATRSSGY